MSHQQDPYFDPEFDTPETTVEIPRMALNLHLSQQVSNLETTLAAIVLKFGVAGQQIILTEQDIRATSGHGFELSHGRPDGSVEARVLTPDMVLAHAATGFMHDAPRRIQ